MQPNNAKSKDELYEEILRLRAENQAQRSALINAHLTLHAVTEQCCTIFSASVPTDTNYTHLQSLTEQLMSMRDSSWLSELRMDAFRLGFSEGYIYAKTAKKQTDSADDARSLFEKSLRTWPLQENVLSAHFTRKTKQPEIVRYEIIDDPTSLFARESDDGELIPADDYRELNLRFEMLKEELHGLQWILHEPGLSKTLSASERREHCKNKLRLSHKPGQIRAQFGNNNGDYDFFVFWGDGVPACDRALVMHLFNGKQMRFDYEKRTPVFTTTFVDEITNRGYDISTLKFSICKRIEST